MHAIRTRILLGRKRGPAFLKAWSRRAGVLIAFQSGKGIEENHRLAAQVLIDTITRLDYGSQPVPSKEKQRNDHFVSGELPDGTFAHVFVKDV